MASGYAGIRAGGPYFDDLARGQVFDWAPAVTLSSGLAAAHQAIVGDRLRLALDADLCAAVTGAPAALAHPGLVCDVAIGQSTLVTHRVKANLFYRGLRFHRFPVIGDTLRTRTEVVGLRANAAKPGRAPTGMAALRMQTIDQADRLVLDFYRCAMLPASPHWRAEVDAASRTDELSTIGADAAPPAADPTAHWDGEAFRSRVPGPHFAELADGIAGSVLPSTADLVSSAPELARLTLNIAATHHDSRIGGGQRLVYGGHTIGLALAQATRLLPNLATVLAWEACDHTGPVHEGDTLYSELRVETAETRAHGGVLGLRSLVYAVSGSPDGPDRRVLDWRFSALQF
ncbi:acyl dehydratase [Mycobacterium shinjukuense]|uniref:Acyl dehydratase n=1 Tax=Mycobacterium shinjukuense TaxID=398694 RepID=A0A7I7MU19_9MYCO|nr:MaoC family dehydratase [Mycobacterium shinjukuense]MCV6986152.1 acyl dehydratase [Mycobacterium shinjukuense]ORB72380.1 acyl dehydratase [Mycobacterium shinjukuense]BBX75357.1 acyl dehydratase [Mycobacterium shinjukuense]